MILLYGQAPYKMHDRRHIHDTMTSGGSPFFFRRDSCPHQLLSARAHEQNQIF